MKSINPLTLGAGIFGGYLADKFFNGGKVSDKIVSGGSTIREVITEKIISGGTIEKITSTITTNSVIEKIVDVGTNLKENISDGIQNVKDKLPSLPSVPNVDINPSNNNSGSGILSIYNNFKKNGGVIAEVSNVAGLGWLADNIKNGTQTFFSGVGNLGTLYNSAFTGEKYNVKKVNGQYIAYNIPNSKSSKNSSGGSRRSSKHSSNRKLNNNPKSKTIFKPTPKSPAVKVVNNVTKKKVFSGPVRPKTNLNNFRNTGRSNNNNPLKKLNNGFKFMNFEGLN